MRIGNNFLKILEIIIVMNGAPVVNELTNFSSLVIFHSFLRYFRFPHPFKSKPKPHATLLNSPTHLNSLPIPTHLRLFADAPKKFEGVAIAVVVSNLHLQFELLMTTGVFSGGLFTILRTLFFNKITKLSKYVMFL